MCKVVQAIPDGKDVAALREKMGLTQAQLAELFGVSPRQWQRKESMESTLNNNTAPMKVGEANFLLLLADAHPHCRLKAWRAEDVIRCAPRDAEAVRQLRIRSGMTQKDIAALMGYTLQAWKSKENPHNAGTLKPGEYNFMLLLTDTHPALTLIEK